MHLHVVPQVGFGGEALVALLAGEGLLLGVDSAVADELCGHPERLPAVGALIALGLRVNAPVVLEGHEVGELLLAGRTEEGPGLVAVLVVEQGASMAVRAPALVAHVGLGDLVVCLSAAAFSQAAGIESLLLHEGEVEARPPAQVLGAPRPVLLGSGLAGLRHLAVSDLHVESEAGLCREGSLAGPAGQLPLLLVDAPVVVQLRGDTERLPAVMAAVAARLRVDAAVVLEGQKVVVGLEAHGTVVDANGVGVLVVEQGAGVAVGATALITPLVSNSICPNFRKIRIPARVWSQGSRIGDHIRVPTLFSLSWGCSGLPPDLHAYLVVPTAVPGQTGPPLETLPAAGAAERGGALLVHLLVVTQEPRQAESFPTRVADVLLALRVNAHVVAQGHVVGVGLVAEVAAEVAGLVGVLVVEQGAGVLVGAAAQVAGIRPLVRVHVHGAPVHADVGRAAGGGRRGKVLSRAVVSREFVCRGKALTAAVALKVHLGPGALWAFAQAGRSVGGELPLGAEAFATLLAVVLLLGEVET